MVRQFVWSLATILLPFSQVGAIRGSIHPVQVPDIVEMTRIIPTSDAEIVRLEKRDGNLRFLDRSPDSRYAVFLTATPSLARNATTYRIEILKLNDPTRAQSHPGAIRTIATVRSNCTGSNEESVSEVRWHGNAALTYLADDNACIPQLYMAWIGSGKVSQLTHARRAVTSYDLSGDAKTLVYSVDVREAPVQSPDPDFVVGNLSLFKVLNYRDKSLSTLRFQLYLERDGKTQPLGDSTAGWIPPRISLSGDGRFAITEMGVVDSRVLRRWGVVYADAFRGHWGARLLKDIDTATMNDHEANFEEFALADLRSGLVTPFPDAPQGIGIGGNLGEALWLNNETVILGNTFLPQGSSGGAGVTAPVVAKCTVRSMRCDALTVLGTDSKHRESQYVHLMPRRSGGFAVTMRDGHAVCFRAGDGNREQCGSPVQANRDQWDGVIVESNESAPEIAVIKDGTGRPVTVSDLNPAFRTLAFGRVRQLNWSDGQGHDFTGGLVLPPAYQSGVRYPLIVQTYGYDKNEFVIDGMSGGMSTAYAAQALAGKGFIVLLLPIVPDVGVPSELSESDAEISSAIAKLQSEGLIEADKIGIYGFSAMGKIVQYMIERSQVKFGAAGIADAWGYDLFDYSLFFGGSPPGMQEAEDLVGARPWGETLDKWVASDPSLHTDKISSPLLFQSIGKYVPDHWVIYTFLRRQKKPAEMMRFPDGAHNLRGPRERFASLQASVDWFDFWLNDRESPDVSRKNQYERWRKMRDEWRLSNHDRSGADH